MSSLIQTPAVRVVLRSLGRTHRMMQACFVAGFILTQSTTHAATLLSYWDFNNVSSTYNSGTLGSFSSTSAGYGEIYTSTNKQITGDSSTGTGVVYGGSSVHLDLSGVTGTVNSGTTTQQGWGAFSDSALNLASGDSSTAAGSLMILGGSTVATQSAVFSLSSQGYAGLSLTYASRVTAASGITNTWSYSLDGNSWTTISTLTPGNGAFTTLNVALPSLLDNAGSFYLKLTINYNYPTFGSAAIDNVQVLAASAVPEPATLGLMGLALVLCCVVRNPLRGCKLRR